jgi:hypothetical protein
MGARDAGLRSYRAGVDAAAPSPVGLGFHLLRLWRTREDQPFVGEKGFRVEGRPIATLQCFLSKMRFLGIRWDK